MQLHGKRPFTHSPMKQFQVGCNAIQSPGFDAVDDQHQLLNSQQHLFVDTGFVHLHLLSGPTQSMIPVK